ncbi:chloride channel protein [Congregibacter variabilis]|uniref:Chloride channel protein n=1 Tax=Congregibacter variabilis TaxID=3081200 RepID=A0ABZ0I3B3_9GAMM|nr:chloride channel protein [Congregibacter sp. IMCC43200]
MAPSFGSYRRALTRYDSVTAYALLGIIAGISSGAAVLAFEHGIEQIAQIWGVGNRGEDYETLSVLNRFLLPSLGGLALGIVFSFLRPEDREVGIVHVISRLHSNYGMLPWRNAVVQFFGGVLALATGQSGGREGPGVHLGSAINSIIGQRLALPNNSLRVLIACGSAGGIAAAFNTPLAGVIFAMEVIIAEYTVAGFMPVMLSAVAASALSQRFGGGSEIFDMSSVQLNTLWEIPYIALLGVFSGCAAAMLIRTSTISAGFGKWPLIVRFTLAGVITGALGIVIPETLGIGYDTLGKVMYGQIALGALLLIAGAKIFATAISVGFGMPVGLIGPTLLIGACLGGFFGQLGYVFYPDIATDPTLYVTIGMAAAMGATFGAPLAACLAVIELTQSTSVAMPALLAIILANLTNLSVFRQRSAHRSVISQLRRQLPDDPLNQLLHRTDVNAVIDGSVVVIAEKVKPAVSATLALQVPNWCLVSRDGDDLFLVSGKDLMAWLQETPDQDSEEVLIRDVSESSLRRWTIAAVPEQATLRQVLDILKARTVEAVCVYTRGQKGKRSLRGIVTRDRIERFTLDHLNA